MLDSFFLSRIRYVQVMAMTTITTPMLGPVHAVFRLLLFQISNSIMGGLNPWGKRREKE
jgi:hypothetical protein